MMSSARIGSLAIDPIDAPADVHHRPARSARGGGFITAPLWPPDVRAEDPPQSTGQLVARAAESDDHCYSLSI